MVSLFVLALLWSGDKFLLLRRVNADFGNGLYSMVGGKVEQGETARQAIRREVKEEVGLDIPETDFKLVHTFHRKTPESSLIAMCFEVDISKLPQPINNEPQKHDDMRFFANSELPDNIISAHKQAIHCIENSISYSEHGW